MPRQDADTRIELRPQTDGDTAFADALTRTHMREAMGGMGDDRLVEIQARSREAMLAHRFPDLRREIARRDGDRVGMLLTATLDGALHVVEIVIAPDRRRQGVGRAMLEQAVARARADDRDVTALIFATNTASQGLFAAAGFSLDLPPDAAQATARLRTHRNSR